MNSHFPFQICGFLGNRSVFNIVYCLDSYKTTNLKISITNNVSIPITTHHAIDQYYEMKFMISDVPTWSLHTRIGIQGVDVRN